MANLLRDHSATLKPELAAMLDVRVLVRTTYALEGDRLEILLVPRRVEELRALGRALAANQDGVLPNVDAVRVPNSDDAISGWVQAAQIVFAISPNSASCERVFSLLETMFGDEQMSALADYIQASLMLRYNKRSVG